MGYRKKRFYDNEAVLNYILIDLKEEEYKDVELDSFEIPTIISYLNDYGDKIINILLANNLVNDGSFDYDTYSFVSNLYSNEKFFNAIMICFKIYKDNEINFNYQNSSKLLEVCLKKGEFKFIDYFSSNAFNSALLCAGNYDLFSDTVISRNITSIY